MKTTEKTEKPTGLALLREPFPANQISKLPKETGAQAEERKANRAAAINCTVCGGWHHRHAIHLDYVGHAALTDRLLDADPQWTWEPLGFTPDGLPATDKNGGLWIKLTVCGLSRLGYGHAGSKTGGDAVKELIGDALRNAAMRFGAALELWHKGELHAEDDETAEDDGYKLAVAMLDGACEKLTKDEFRTLFTTVPEAYRARLTTTDRAVLDGMVKRTKDVATAAA